ncbi:MAG: prepilin-type N-terminal cleavage/methylation domain-containing protein [Pseudomonadota bacterium]|nr:prepilin-type N-terminal cleavage/methylation domain-containing protein [Pseudomonadota bacterium]
MSPPSAAHGFSLVEVLVALIIVSVGLLGIAKMQALLIADSGVSRVRALVALEASSLAASMHANRDYWAGIAAPVSVTVDPASTPAVSASGDATLSTGISAAVADPQACESTVVTYCTPANMAGYDLVQWEMAMKSLLPSSTTQVNCQNANLQVYCTVTIDWTENIANANAQEQGSAALQNQSYQLVVSP